MQCLASGPLKVLPAQFIRPAEERPGNTIAEEGVAVPVISMYLPHDVLVKQVAEAASEWGFMLITDHGIPIDLIKRLQEVGEAFFALPQKEKEAYANDPSIGNFEGYGTKMTKNIEEKVEWIDYYFHHIAPPSKVNYNMWPKKPSSYRFLDPINAHILFTIYKVFLHLSFYIYMLIY